MIVLEAAHEAGKDASAAVIGARRRPGDGIVVVVQHAGGARNKALADALRKAGAQVVRCDKITAAAERADFVRAEIRRAGGTITRRRGRRCWSTRSAPTCGNSRRPPAQLVADTGGTVDADAVRALPPRPGRGDGFAIADKAVAGDGPGALEALRWALVIGVAAGADRRRAGRRRAHHRARSARRGRGDPYRLAAALGMPPWKVQKAQAQARGWRPDGLAVAVAAAAEAERRRQGRRADPDYALEGAVLRTCAARDTAR